MEFTDLLTDVNETVAVFSEPGWLLRLEGHVEDLAQVTQLYAALLKVAATAGTAGLLRNSNSNLNAAAGQVDVSTAGLQGSGQVHSEGKEGTGTAGGQIRSVPKPDWSDDSDVLRGRLLELGGVAGLQTDTDCLLLKDLCRPGIEDNAFLDLIDQELQVRGSFSWQLLLSFAAVTVLAALVMDTL